MRDTSNMNPHDGSRRGVSGSCWVRLFSECCRSLLAFISGWRNSAINYASEEQGQHDRLAFSDSRGLLEQAHLDALGLLDEAEQSAFEHAFANAAPKVQKQVRLDQHKWAVTHAVFSQDQIPTALQSKIIERVMAEVRVHSHQRQTLRTILGRAIGWVSEPGMSRGVDVRRTLRIFSFCLPGPVRQRAFEPAYEDLAKDYKRASRYRGAWTRRWLTFCFLIRAALLVVQSLRAFVLDQLLWLLPPAIRGWFTRAK